MFHLHIKRDSPIPINDDIPIPIPTFKKTIFHDVNNITNFNQYSYSQRQIFTPINYDNVIHPIVLHSIIDENNIIEDNKSIYIESNNEDREVQRNRNFRDSDPL